MAESTQVAAKAAKAPTGAQVERAKDFAREPFLLDGEKLKDLVAGSARRMALDDALAELDAGRETPSIEWRGQYSLMLGLERVLSEEVPKLADGAELNPHQVDALSGTLAALITEIEGEPGAEPADSNGADPADEEPEARDSVEEAEEEIAEEDDDLDEEPDEDEPQEEEDDELAPDEEPMDFEEAAEDTELAGSEVLDDPGASRRFWFEHATGAGKTVAAVGFIEASRTGGILILTHRRNLVDQFIGEISDRGYGERLSPPLLGDADHPYGPVTVETYQWFVRNAGKVSDAYSIVICDEAHTALGEKTSGCIRAWTGPVFIGMTATGALIARHVADLFPTQTSRFDLGQAARRGVISPLRCIRIPPGAGVRTIAKVPLRKGEVDQDFDQEELAKLLDQGPFNVAIADLYKSRFRKVPGVIYTAGVKHANNVAKAFQDAGHQRPRRLWRDPEARARRDPGRLRARRGRRPLQRDAAGRGLELAPRDHLHAPGPDRVEAHLPAARRPSHPPQPRQGGRPGARLRPPGDHPRRERRHPPQPARPRRLPRRRDRRRPRPPRPRPPGPGREAGRPRLRRLRPPPAGAGARALADRRREPRPPRAARLGRTGRRPRQPVGLAACQGDASARLDQGAPPPVPAHLHPAQPQLTASPQGPRRDRAASRPRGLRRRDRHRRHLDRATTAAPAPASCSRRWPSAASAAATRPRPGSGGSPATRATSTRSTRCSAGPRPSACSGCSSTLPAAPTDATPAAWSTPSRNQDRRLQAAAARRRGGPHPRGRGGAARSPHARGPQALRSRPRAAPELPQVRRIAPAPAQAQGRRRQATGTPPTAPRAERRRRQSQNGADANGSDRGGSKQRPKRKPKRKPAARKPRAAAADPSDD